MEAAAWAAAAVTVGCRATVSSAAGRLAEAVEAARMPAPGRLGRDGLITPVAEVMGMWSVPAGAATGRFEVHSILSVCWWVLDCNNTIYRVMLVVKPGPPCPDRADSGYTRRVVEPQEATSWQSLT